MKTISYVAFRFFLAAAFVGTLMYFAIDYYGHGGTPDYPQLIQGKR